MISRTSALLVLLLGGAAAAQPKGPSIDSILAEKWEELSIRPAALVDDAELLRRLSLDLIGRVPTIEELRAFVAKPDKRHHYFTSSFADFEAYKAAHGYG